ncbi:unnamed protein product [Schistosoma mattheei]|uniref:SAP domain-containing protein n=1 Tax=Schistosoma mattheei TaxID=31246 RepID=A0A3P8JJD0_9TREM|nr:unnamed protein product [Schistosoma mattheei]
MKKICKENKLPSTGTKVELISRITEMHGKLIIFILYVSELLGDDEDGDSNHVNISHTTTTEMDCSNSNGSPNGLNFPAITANKTVGRKRPASELTPEKDSMTSGEKVLKIAHTTDDSHDNAKEEIKNLSDSERLISRTKRFMSDDEKTIARAKRFGLPISNTLTNLERKAKRLEKFGKPLSSVNTQINDELAKSIRAQKFGLVLSSNNSMSDAEKLSKRQARFGLVDNKI